MRNNKFAIITMFLLLVSTSNKIDADIVGLSLANISFSRTSNDFTPGLHLIPGVNINLTQTLELGLFTINQITPDPFYLNYPGFSFGYNLLGSRTDHYFNILIETGFVVDFKESKFLFFNFSPLSLGDVSIGYRERVFNIGLLYNIDSGKYTVFWQLLSLSFYP